MTVGLPSVRSNIGCRIQTLSGIGSTSNPAMLKSAATPRNQANAPSSTSRQCGPWLIHRDRQARTLSCRSAAGSSTPLAAERTTSGKSAADDLSNEPSHYPNR
jgi:hypothetical protein